MKLLIVDDDYQIREGLLAAMDWEDMGFQEVRAAANGIEALQIYQEMHPEMILTDIQMPGMTGLELIEEVRKTDRTAKILFISAYSEFEYARRALLLGADDYILKPIQVLKLEETIRKNVAAWQKEKQQGTDARQALLVKETLRLYANQEETDGTKLCRICAEEYSFMEGGWFQTIVMESDRSGGWKQMELAEVEKTVQSFVLEENGILLPPVNGVLIAIVPGSNSELLSICNQNEWAQKIKLWNQMYKETYGSISGGISQSHGKASFSKAYEQAVNALEERFFAGAGSITPVSAPLKRAKETVQKKEILRLLQNSLKENDRESLAGCVEKLSERLHSIGESGQEIRKIYLNCYWELCEEKKQFARINELREQMDGQLFVQEINRLMSDYLWEDICLQRQKKKKMQTLSHTMQLAVNYIQEHYAEPITLQEVAGVVHKSAPYFSSIFKKEMGCGFAEYLTTVRLESAYEKILKSDKKIKEIALEFGYNDYVYFSQQFKQKYGLAATELRNTDRK